MRATLNRVSLVTEVDAPHRAFDPGLFYRPAKYRDVQFARVLFHEATHYWQQLSEGFLVSLAEEDWVRLQRFKLTGDVPEPGALRREFQTRNRKLGFSVHDIAEAAARYWDLVTMGPHDLIELEIAKGTQLDDYTSRLYEEAQKRGLFRNAEDDDGFSQVTVDLAMRIVGGHYARPYLFVQEKLGYDAILPCFPMLAHWSLQTRHPVQFLAELSQRWGRLFEQVAGPPRKYDLEAFQRSLYWKFCAMANYLSQRRDGLLLLGRHAIARGPLATHPIYAWAARWLDLLGQELVEHGWADDIGDDPPPPEMLPLVATDRALCLCGGRDERVLLWERVPPPMHRFRDDKTWFPMVDADRAANLEVAEDCMMIHTAWEELRAAERGY